MTEQSWAESKLFVFRELERLEQEYRRLIGEIAINKDVLEGRFSGGDLVLGLREGGVGLAPVGKMVPEAQREPALAQVERLREAIIAGKLTAPATLDELSKFMAARP